MRGKQPDELSINLFRGSITAKGDKAVGLVIPILALVLIAVIVGLLILPEFGLSWLPRIFAWMRMRTGV